MQLFGELINVDEVFRHAFSYQKERCNVDEQVLPLDPPTSLFS